MTTPQTLAPWWHRVDPGIPAWLVTAAVVWGVHGFRNGLSRDSALYVYAGQAVAGGDAPYVEVLNRAGPLAHLLPGLGVALGRAADLGDVVGIRMVFFLLVVATPVLTYVLARDGYGSRLAGSAAAATLLAFEGLALSATDGPHSKQPMMLGLLIAILLLTRHRWLTGGIVTGLATLTWQPVLAVLVPVALIVAWVSPGLRRARVWGLVRFGAGGLSTLAAAAAYFALADALAAFVEGFWGVNAGYTDQQGLVDRPLWAWGELTEWLGWTTSLLAAGVVTSIVLGALALRRSPDRGMVAAALGTATLAGVAWSAVAFNGAPDSMLVLPLAATGIGGGVAALAARVPEARRRVPTVLVAGAVAVAVGLTCHLTWTDRGRELDVATAEAEALFASVPGETTVFAFNAPQPLALTGRVSISRFVLFGEGMEEYVASRWTGGIRGYVECIRDRQPTVVVTSPRGLTGTLRPLARDYTEVAASSDWRAFIHEVDVPRQRVVAGRDLRRKAQ